jgi:hypothetical protein
MRRQAKWIVRLFPQDDESVAGPTLRLTQAAIFPAY